MTDAVAHMTSSNNKTDVALAFHDTDEELVRSSPSLGGIMGLSWAFVIVY